MAEFSISRENMALVADAIQAPVSQLNRRSKKRASHFDREKDVAMQ